MNKKENVFPSKEVKIKEDNKNPKCSKIKKNNHNVNSIKEISKKLANNYFNKLALKEKVKSQKNLNDLSKMSKKLESKNRNLNRIDITMNFNLTNFTTYNETNKILDKKLIENYSGKKRIFHKRQISDGFQKIKVINTGNFVNIKVNTKDNKTSTNKEIQNMKKMNNKSKTNFINYVIKENDKINNTNNYNYIYNSVKDLSSYDKISNLKINVSNLSNKKDYKKLIGDKKFNKININNKNLNLTNMTHMKITKSAVNLNKKEKDKINNTNNIKNIPLDNNIFSKKIMINNSSFKYKKFKNYTSETKKNLKTDISKKVFITNSIKEKKNKNESSLKSKCNLIIPNDKMVLFPLNINTSGSTGTYANSKKIINYNINKSCDGLNNINNNSISKNLYKKVSINLNSTSRNNTNRESTNFMTDKNKINEEENKYRDKDNIENNPEMNFFDIVKLIQKSKNSIY